MSAQPIDADDLAAALTAFSIELAAAIFAPQHQTPNEMLEALANGLDGLAGKMADTNGGAAIKLTAKMLMASEVER
jgi:hypothetical protein